jgi:hypothetical protein
MEPSLNDQDAVNGMISGAPLDRVAADDSLH